MENERIIMMEKRQSGLDDQMRVYGKCPMVYDRRVFKKLSDVKFDDYSPNDFWFVDGVNRDLPLFDKKDPHVVVSAYFGGGEFRYSCMGEMDSDPQYVLVKTNYKNLDKVAESLAKKGGEQIIYGTEISQRKCIDTSLQLKSKGLEEKVFDIMSLPKDEQEKEVRRLLSYQNK